MAGNSFGVSVKMSKVIGTIDVDFSARQFNGMKGTWWVEEELARALVAAEFQEMRIGTSRKDRRHTDRVRVGRGYDGRLGSSVEDAGECAKVVGSQAKLIAGQDQDALRFRRNSIESAKARVDRCGNSLLPSVIQDPDRTALRNDGGDFMKERAKDGDDRRCSGFLGQAHCSLKQGFAVEDDQLFGPAKAAAGAGGEKDCGDGHRNRV